MRSLRKQAAQILRQIPVMRHALRSLTDRIEAEQRYLDGFRSLAASEAADREKIDEHLFCFEQLSLEKELLSAQIGAVETAMGRLSAREKAVLEGFFKENYDAGVPLDLMDEMGYEKSALYELRGRALDRFAAYYGLSGPRVMRA